MVTDAAKKVSSGAIRIALMISEHQERLPTSCRGCEAKRR